MAHFPIGLDEIAGIANTKGNTGGITISAGQLPDGVQVHNGLVDDTRIYNCALTSSEIWALFSEGGWNPAPAAPKLLVATPGDRRVSLTWLVTTEPDLASYYLYRHTARDSKLVTPINTLPRADTSTTDIDLTNGTTYWYWLSAVDSAGNESKLSMGRSATPRNLTPPSVPTGVIAAEGDSSVTLAWSPNTEADLSHYVVYQGTTAGFTPTSADSAARVNAPDTSVTLTGLANDTTYYFRITAVDSAGNYSGFSVEVSATPVPLAVDSDVGVPGKFALHQNYPNPFNPTTTIQFDLPVATEVHLAVYDLLGREIIRLVDSRLEVGFQQVIWNARDSKGRELPTGMYIVLMVTPEFTKSIKMLLLK